jgi:hypothetical protein
MILPNPTIINPYFSSVMDFPWDLRDCRPDRPFVRPQRKNASFLWTWNRAQYDLKRRSETIAVVTVEINGVPLSCFISLGFNLYLNPIRVVEKNIAQFKPAVRACCGLVLSACWRAIAGLVQCDGCALQLVASVSRLGVYNSCDGAPPSCARIWCECRRRGWCQCSDAGRCRRSLKDGGAPG